MSVPKYLFETEQFGLSHDSIHLLRSRYNFKTYNNSEISQISIQKGRAINNWLFVLILGMGMLIFSIYYSYKFYLLLTSDQNLHLYVEQFVIPVLPLMLGTYSIFQALRTCPVFKIALGNGKTKTLTLEKALKEDQLENLKQILTESSLWKYKTTIKL